MKVFGLTGGIAVGKTVILQELERRGYPGYRADVEARWLMEHDSELREAVRSLLGEEAYTPDGSLNRSWIAERIFAEPLLRSQLNALVHPRTLAHFVEWVERQRSKGHIAVFKEAALTIEAGAWQGLSGLIVVYAPLPVRLKRLQERDQLPPHAALSRLKAQMPEWHKLHYADHVCLNNGLVSISDLVDGLLRAFQLPLSTQVP